MKSTPVWLLAGGLALMGCSSSTPNSAERSIRNSDIERNVRAKFAAEPSIPSELDVRADVIQNQITLSGTVPSAEVQNKAVELAKSASPGATVVDRLQLAPQEVARADYNEDLAKVDREKARALGDSIGTSLDDAYIHAKILGKLLFDRQTPAANIHVDVKEGVVTLRGEVDSAGAKKEAGRVAEVTDGVKRVNNRLKVKAG